MVSGSKSLSKMISKTIAEIFRDIAKILEIKGDPNIFRARAYERAARNIESLSEDIQDLINENRLTEIPGVGNDLAQKIIEITKTGKLKFLEELKKSIPEGLLELLHIPSVGPKHAKLFYDELGIKSIKELEEFARKGKLLELEGIKKKTVENILKGIALLKKGRERMDLAQAINTADKIIQSLKNNPYLQKISACGSLRRMKETVRDIDILAVSDNPDKIMDAFLRLPFVKDVRAKGLTKSSVITKEGAQIDLRVVEERNFGAALIYFTGSKNFNIKLRQLAIKKKLKINEYGVFKVPAAGGSASGGKGDQEAYLCGESEEEVFASLGLQFIQPELREDGGEIELSAQGKLPQLLTLKDIKGDLHAHSQYSDGRNSIFEMAKAARGLGYEYLNMSDHSQSLKVAGGLSVEDLKIKRAEINKLNSPDKIGIPALGREKLKDFKIFFGAEVDIDSSGKMDYPDDILAEFDIVIAAIHTGFKQAKQQITKRLVRACKNKNVDIIAHPTGKLWGTRDPYEIDFEEFFKAASDYGIVLEVSAYPLRLDLNDVNCRKAKEKGIKMAVSTDSHNTDQLKFMPLGVATARRGWLTKDDVINSLSGDELLNFFTR